ncbi:spore coat protein [Clostridium zeae]|uniref:Spore coat protein n=1 Tax=Clostridium zeae TaxID=2759022 RepID=A0ABQ1E9H9_9CLOT|nr:CotS family spore coat protein [Clostridium zeae]GFZ31349.1 spore coat protein [Clostridium zeae]
MLKLKYGDKKYLCEYDLNIELFNKFSIEVADLVPVRSVFVLETSKGKKILKKIDYSIDRLNFISQSLEFIKNTFNRALTIDIAADGNRYVLWDGGVYTLLDLIEGRECAFSNIVDLSISARDLAVMHKSSIGIIKNINGKVNTSYSLDQKDITLGNLEGYFKYSLSDIKKLKEQVISYRHKNEFDKLFLNEVDYYIDEVKECVELLKDSKYNDLCKEEDKIVVCHGDLAHHNILIKDEEAYFIDFDYCSIDLRVKDIAQLVTKAIKNFAYDMDKFNTIIDAYTSVLNLSKEEYKLLYILLKFPSDFYTAVSDYYYKNKDWDEDVFLARFTNKLEFREDREEFLKEFNNEKL